LKTILQREKIFESILRKPVEAAGGISELYEKRQLRQLVAFLNYTKRDS
jgi:hypothetical protein